MTAILTDTKDTTADAAGQCDFRMGRQLRAGAGVEDSRHSSLDFLIYTTTVLTNTFFDKRPENQVTYRT